LLYRQRGYCASRVTIASTLDIHPENHGYSEMVVQEIAVEV